MGLEGEDPKTVIVENIHQRCKDISKNKKINLNSEYEIFFDPSTHLLFHKKKILSYHTNGMMFTAYGQD